MERYYIKVKGLEGSKVAHDSLEDAYVEAQRLFNLNNGEKLVYVLQVIGTIEPKPQTRKTRKGVKDAGESKGEAELCSR